MFGTQERSKVLKLVEKFCPTATGVGGVLGGIGKCIKTAQKMWFKGFCVRCFCAHMVENIP